jgi:hypothetical protein
MIHRRINARIIPRFQRTPRDLVDGSLPYRYTIRLSIPARPDPIIERQTGAQDHA